MAVVGGILGVIVGFAIGVIFTEVIFANNQEWPIVVPFGLAVLGWLVGTSTVRRLASRSAKQAEQS
jgi:F0F1-type ATP synthase assembly protein I